MSSGGDEGSEEHDMEIEMQHDKVQSEEKKLKEEDDVTDGVASDSLSNHSKQSHHEAMKSEQVHFSMSAMEELGRSAAGLRESAEPIMRDSQKRDSPGGGSNIFKKIRDPANQRHSSAQQPSMDGRGSEKSIKFQTAGLH